MAAKKRGLGKGLDALIGITLPSDPKLEAATSQDSKGSEIYNDNELKQLPIEFLQTGRYQPRKDMSPEALEELTLSIKAQGVIQPIVVRPIANKKYEIVAGERRWRATQQAGLESIPCIVKDLPDEAAIAIALIENIQREDLNPMEEAVALQRLQSEFQLTHQQVADAVGKSRTTVTNLLRLNTLCQETKTLLERGDIEMGHARALLTLNPERQSDAVRTVVAKSLTVRQTEALVRQIQLKTENGSSESPRADPDVRLLQDKLAATIGAPVAIVHSAKGKGKLVIKYNSLDELDGILDHIK
ncbi:MAG: ParB/RepB/Spo0J family partition protein [Pseudomonadales bacterium]|nr:ParB/RepB/Spo0J family partition protein [Pseudomonadales bacterium]